MTQNEYMRLQRVVLDLKWVASQYAGRTIENIIENIETRCDEAIEKGFEQTKRMSPKRPEVNDIVKEEGKRYLCQKADSEACTGCAFEDSDLCQRYFCSKDYRNDRTNVIFVELKEPSGNAE